LVTEQTRTEPRKPYTPPLLIVHGTIDALTGSSGNDGGDALVGSLP